MMGCGAAWTINQGDLLPVYIADVSSCSGQVDFTGWTFTFQIRGPVVRGGVATGDALGVLTYAWVAGDTDVPGDYEAVFFGVAPGGLPQTFPVESALRISAP